MSLAAQIAVEPDPTKFQALVMELNHLLAEKEHHLGEKVEPLTKTNSRFIESLGGQAYNCLRNSQTIRETASHATVAIHSTSKAE